MKDKTASCRPSVLLAASLSLTLGYLLAATFAARFSGHREAHFSPNLAEHPTSIMLGPVDLTRGRFLHRIRLRVRLEDGQLLYRVSLLDADKRFRFAFGGRLGKAKPSGLREYSQALLFHLMESGRYFLLLELAMPFTYGRYPERIEVEVRSRVVPARYLLLAAVIQLLTSLLAWLRWRRIVVVRAGAVGSAWHVG